MKIAQLMAAQFDELSITILQDRIKQILDILCGNAFAQVYITQLTFPDSKHPTVHADGTTGYDLFAAHGQAVQSPRFFATTLKTLTLPAGLTAPDMTKAVINTSPDNTAKNTTPSKTILLTCSQPSVTAQVVFF